MRQRNLSWRRGEAATPRAGHPANTTARGKPPGGQIAIVVLMLGLMSMCPANAEPTMSVVSTWGGEVRAVCVDPISPDILYVGSGRCLVVLDATNPNDIQELGRIDLGNLVLDIKVRDGHAFVGTYSKPERFCTVSVADPANMYIAWHSSDRFPSWLVELHGDEAWVQSETNMLRFNIADPEAPTGGGIVIGDLSRAFTIVGDRMYIASNDSSGLPRLHVYDLGSNRTEPALLGTGELDWAPHGFNPTALCVVGDYVYMTLMEGFLAVWDVSDPNAPTHVGSYDGFTGMSQGGLAIHNGIAYVVSGQTLQLLDVATAPTAPTLLDTVNTHGGFKYVKIVGSRLYAMSPGEGLIIFDLSTRSGLTRQGTWHSPAYPGRMDTDGERLFVSDTYNGLSILDVTDPQRPALISTYQTSEASGEWGDNWDVQVRDGLAYLAAGRSGLEIIDVSDPAQPAMSGSFPFPSGLRARALELDGEIAHVGVTASAGGSLVNFNISNPQAIEDVGWLGLGAPPVKFQTDDMLTHTVAGTTGLGGGRLYAIATADPNAPELEWEDGSAPLNWAKDLAVEGSVRCVTNCQTDDTGGLYIQDVTDPIQPQTVGFLQAHAPSRLMVRAGVAYMISTWGGQRSLVAIDVSDWTAPVPLGYVKVPGAWHVLLDGQYAYVNSGVGVGDNGSTGLAIVEMSGIAAWGDLNCDGAIDFDDIDPFVLALAGKTGYQDTFPDCNWYHGDCNGDNQINFDDIDPFVELLTGR